MTDELDRIERRAQEVRSQLALDIDELFLRLQPRRVVRNAGAYARETVVAYGGDAQTVSGLGRDIVREMRRNPIPYLLVGIGVAGLAWVVSSFSRSRIHARLPEFSEADFAPPSPPRAASVRPVAPAAAPTATTPMGTTMSTTRPPTSLTPAGTREISPVTPAER